MKRLTVLISILALGIACETYDDFVPYEVYTIKAGRHSSGLKNNQLQFDYLAFDVIFDETAVYETEDPNNQADVNKLFGFADCNSNHIDNSARFGWRWYENKLQILGFTHSDGEIEILDLVSVELNRSYRYELYLDDEQYFFRVSEPNSDLFTQQVFTMPRSNEVCDIGFYYRLWPYFGGDETAPHDINLHMRRVYEYPD